MSYELRYKTLFKRKIEIQDLKQKQDKDKEKFRALSETIRSRAQKITKLTKELLEAI